MVMDFGRSGSLRDCQFFRDSPVASPIKWYRAPAGAKPFPSVHRFSRLSWYTEPWQAEGVGEVYLARETWNPGDTPAGVTGQSYFGTLEDFQQGAVYDPAAAIARTPFGLAVACPSCLLDVIAMEEGGCSAVLQEDATEIDLENP